MDEVGKSDFPGNGGIAGTARKGGRASLFLQASVKLGDGPATPMKVRNLSPGGMMIDCIGAPPVGTRIEATIRGLETVGGAIVWVKARSAGVTFDREIDPSEAMKPVSRSISPDRLLTAGHLRGGRPGLKSH